MSKRRILVTSALTYANGPAHLGHMVEFIQTDIWARLQRMRGHECYYIGGSDAHGTPIMLKAEQEGITPEQLISQVHAEQAQDCADFHIDFANFYGTHSPENKQLATAIFKRLEARGDIESRTIKQAFDQEKQMFLPDRYVKGECPKCGAADQYGDNCEHCGATYAPLDLINPRSVLTGSTPVEKDSEHLFFKLENYSDLLQSWLQKGHLQSEVVNKLQEWFEAGLKSWDISRDAPYFGFEIPGHDGKYFYVWLDAPIGYMASFLNFCEQHPALSFDDFWKEDSETELYHFVGKDIVYFHALFWPAILSGSQHRLPTAVFSHGFLTVDGLKMSKSRGTFITARHYLDHLNPDYLRYYYAAKLGSTVQDINLDWQDFMSRVNSDLVGKVVNIASRCAGFIHKKFEGLLSENRYNPELFSEFIAQSETIAQHYENRDYHKAMRLIMELADKANQYIATEAPWALIKQPGNEARVHAVCSDGINLFRHLITYLKPVTPDLTVKAEAFLNAGELTWDNGLKPLCNHPINPFKPLLTRITDADLAAVHDG